MIDLTELRATDLAKVVAILRRIEADEARIAAILRDADRKGPPLRVSVRNLRMPRGAQPSLREMITGILRKTGKPMSVAEICEAILAEGYHWRSRDPINALNVKMYTDRTFKKASPGKFVLASQA